MRSRILWHFRALSLLFLTLFLVGCEKEEIIPANYGMTSAVQKSTKVSANITADNEFLTNRQKTQVLTYFNKSYSSKSENSDEQLEKAILSIIDNPAKRLAVPEYGYDAYTFYVPFNRDDRFGNLTLQVVNDTVIAGYFTLYEMTENYAERFNRNAASITQFEGKVRSVRLDKFLRLLGKWSGAKNEDEDCFVYAFDGTDSHEASPGSGSGSGGSSDDSGSNTGDPWGETIPAVPYPSAARLLPESQMGVVAQAIPDPAVNRMVAGTAEPIRGFVTNTS